MSKPDNLDIFWEDSGLSWFESAFSEEGKESVCPISEVSALMFI